MLILSVNNELKVNTRQCSELFHVLSCRLSGENKKNYKEKQDIYFLGQNLKPGLSEYKTRYISNKNTDYNSIYILQRMLCSSPIKYSLLLFSTFLRMVQIMRLLNVHFPATFVVSSFLAPDFLLDFSVMGDIRCKTLKCVQ